MAQDFEHHRNRPTLAAREAAEEIFHVGLHSFAPAEQDNDSVDIERAVDNIELFYPALHSFKPKKTPASPAVARLYYVSATEIFPSVCRSGPKRLDNPRNNNGSWVALGLLAGD